MSSKGKSKYWSAGTLFSRGWTDTLMRELLPKPRWETLNGRRMRCWDRDEVLAAEDTERFQTEAKQKRVREAEERVRHDADTQAALNRAAELLESAFAGAESGGEEELLARRYHEGILSLLPSLPHPERLRRGQAESYIGSFLALATPRSGENINNTLRHLAAAAWYMGRNEEGSAVKKLLSQYRSVLLSVAERTLAAFRAAQPEADVRGMLSLSDFPARELLSHPLSYVYSVHYVPRAIRSSLSLLVALNPKDEYPEARSMRRHFILHLGGTNTGKTYAGFQRLMEVESGVYLSPLRLLALEAQETLLDAHVRCSLTTGEEEDRMEGDTHVAATCEKLDMKRQWDVAVIDECQMIADAERGYAWTRAILGVLAPEVHLCAAPEAEGILLQLIAACGDSYEIQYHTRKAPLYCMKRPMDYTDVQPGDALITFSKVGVLSVAEDLRSRGKKPAIIYGALPYSARRRQMEEFLGGNARYVVSTDAIGMGLNLPIRRIIFMETRKFDGKEVRDLTPAEIKQIAGRAGRFGMYDKGYVGATDNLELIRAGLESTVPPISKAVVGFSDLVLQVDFDLLQVLEEWNRMPTVEPYVKLDITRYISLISRIREEGFRLEKEQELRAANIPFDETDPELLRLFFHFLRVWAQGAEPERPALPDRNAGSYTLPQLEQHCRKLDLYFSFSRAFECGVDEDALHAEREQVADWINQILLHNLRNNIRFCAQCGAALPLHYKGRLCNACFRKIHAAAAGRRKR